jgi:hypothetical protein
MEDCNSFDQFGESIPTTIFSLVGSSIFVSICYNHHTEPGQNLGGRVRVKENFKGGRRRGQIFF